MRVWAFLWPHEKSLAHGQSWAPRTCPTPTSWERDEDGEGRGQVVDVRWRCGGWPSYASLWPLQNLLSSPREWGNWVFERLNDHPRPTLNEFCLEFQVRSNDSETCAPSSQPDQPPASPAGASQAAGPAFPSWPVVLLVSSLLLRFLGLVIK